MRKGQEVEITITGLRYPNDTYGYVEEKKIYVKNAVIGQKVKARIIKVRRDKCESKTIEVLEKAEFETEATCPHNEKCGGCTWNTVPYEKQLEMKQQGVKDLLDKNGIAYESYEPIMPSPVEMGYRNKMEFSFGDEVKDGPLTLGMHEKGRFNSVVTVEQCQLCDGDFTKLLSATLTYAKENHLPKKSQVTHKGVMRHLLVRKGIQTGEILVILVTQGKDHDFTPWKNAIMALELKGKITGVHHMINNGLGDSILCDELITLYGRDYIFEEILGLKFKITPFSFFQTNTLGAEILYKEGIESIKEIDSKVVYDLYSGTGTIGQIVASKAKKVYGIELVEEAVIAANENAKNNGIENFVSVAGDVFVMLETLPERPEVIIVDPPRAGISEKAMDKILHYGVKEILYISCNPKTLVENLKQAMAKGYRITKVRCVDMFAATPNVEVVVMMEKK